MINGIDVSSVQTNINWGAVAASGVQFMIAKCGNGNSGIDPNYAANIAGAQAAGLQVTCYHFVYPLPPKDGDPSRSPRAQAQAHFDASQGVLACCDLEWPVQSDWAKWGCSAAQIRQWALDYLATYSALSGRPMIVYTYPNYAQILDLASSPEFAQYPLWIASYEPTPTIPAPWNSYVLWQNTGGGGKLPNGEPVDTDVANDLSLWQAPVAFVQPPDVPVVQPPPPVVAPVPEPVSAPTNDGSSIWTSIGNVISQLYRRK